MTYTILNNFRTFYLNILANFYLCFNTILPYYDDLIITLQKKALINLYKGTSCSEIKKKRFVQFMNDVYELMHEYTIMITEDKNIAFEEKETPEYSDEESDTDMPPLESDSDTDKED